MNSTVNLFPFQGQKKSFLYHMQVYQTFDFPPSWICSIWSIHHHFSKASSLDSDVYAEKVSQSG